MSNESILLAQNSSYFSPISVLHYEYYKSAESVLGSLTNNENIQYVSGFGSGFGKSQQPGLADYADGADTMQFLRGL
jgi:hypothetical protein